MNTFLETAGSFIIGGMILLIIISFNLNMNTNSIENIQNAFILNNSVVNASIFDYDLYKVGFRATSNKICIADSNRLKFAADIDNNSIIDTIEYKTGTTSDMSATFNPNDQPVLRKLNGGSYYSVAVVSNLIFSYFDSLGTKIPYGYLAYQTNRDRIRTIKIEASFQSDEPSDTTYGGLNWTKTYRPKNLR